MHHTMKATFCILCLVAMSGSVAAQALAPELAPLATKYKADIATLETQRAAAIAQLYKPYAAALVTAEKSATTAGNVAGVSVIATERAALASGLMSPGFPPGLPKELQNPRKAYLEGVARIRTAEAPRRQALDAAYLRALTDLNARAAKNPELAKQLEAERQKLLASAPTTSAGKSNSKNVIINGTFDAADPSGKPGGWSTAEGFKVQKDGANNVLHASFKAPVYAAASQDITLPARARSVTLRGRVRGKILARDAVNSQGPPGVFVAAVYLDKSEQATKNWLMLDGGSDAEWKNVSSTTKIPDDMKVLEVSLVLKNVSGEFDFDNIEVEFR
jgi:hypothetical protein